LATTNGSLLEIIATGLQPLDTDPTDDARLQANDVRWHVL
jgi:hypothetical protein